MNGTALDLYCVPHAGGSARAFVGWRRAAPPGLRVVPLELAGRGRRSREPHPDTLPAAAADLAAAVAARLTPGGRYAVLGHSLGGLVGYELVRCLLRAGAPAPELLVVAATRPPHLVAPAFYADVLELADEPLIDALVAAGTVPASLRQGAMWRAFVPILRADVALLAGYRPELPARLPVDLAVWHGTADPTTPTAVLRGWRRHTARGCTFTACAGGHFFLHSNVERLAARLTERDRAGRLQAA